jgi:hypothetical protein
VAEKSNSAMRLSGRAITMLASIAAQLSGHIGRVGAASDAMIVGGIMNSLFSFQTRTKGVNHNYAYY